MPPGGPGMGMPPGMPPGMPLPDFSRPPPGFPSMPQGPPVVNEADLMPSVPYFELPAGLMAPLVKLDDSTYRPLEPGEIRLPPPMPPSERLLMAVEAFYSPPFHDRPRDAEGWEKLGLYEFFKAKQKAKKMSETETKKKKDKEEEKEEKKETRFKEDRKDKEPAAKDRKRRSRSGSPLPYQPNDDSPPYKRSSRSRSPPYKRKSRSKSRSRSRSSSSSRSRTRSRSASGTPENTPPRRANRKRSKSKSRSPTPPSFFNEPFYQTTDTRLGDENKGAQLMKKMGWGGGGLGQAEQGRVDPVESAEVRDRVDMYKGIGNNMTDPFEQFRKSKSQGYSSRLAGKGFNERCKSALATTVSATPPPSGQY